MTIDIGDKKPLQGDHVYRVARLNTTVDLYDHSSNRYYSRKLKTVTPDELVAMLGGPATFASYVSPYGGVIWFRREWIRGIYSVPEPIARECGEGSLLQMTFQEPMPDPWPPKRRCWPAYVFAFTESVEEIERMLSETEERPFTAVKAQAAVAVRRDHLVEALAKYDLQEVADSVLSAARLQWFLSVMDICDTPSAGLTRIGGDPDLPDGTAWPASSSGPLSFLAQINMSDLPNGREGGLPATGLLSFFYDIERQPWGSESADFDGWAVLYSDVPTKSSEAPSAAEVLSCHALKVELGIGVPTDETAHTGFELPCDGELSEAYFELTDDLYSQAPGSWVAGYSFPLQDDMHEEVADAANRALGMDSRPDEWRLLIQLESEPEVGMSWADEGRLYYWILATDLDARRFDRVWVILQSF